MYKPTIGLEIHIELNTKSKMFCSCKNDPDERRPNVNICPVCTAQPGTLPVINEEAVRKVIKTGLALNCQIPEYSKFDRKNYFYPDLPKGYQISQYDKPLCIGGFLELDNKKIRITRVHLEEDTGRLVHITRQEQIGDNRNVRINKETKEVTGIKFSAPELYSLVDFNRAGIPLMELVTEPDITSAKEAKDFAEELHLIMHYLGVSDADMEKGQMRVEVNISLSADKKLGTKVEIKNLNSFRAVERGIDYEIERQTEILKSGKKIIQETRGWNDIKGITVSQREKEEAHDYRYFPEPDLPPLHHKKEFIDEIRAKIPELPQKRRERLKREYKLDEKSIEIFIYKKNLGEYFEKVISEFEAHLPKDKLHNLIKTAANYLITDLQGLLKGVSVSDKTFLISAENFAEFINLIQEGKISSKIAKQVLAEMFKTGVDPSNIIQEKGLTQITDETEIEKIIKEIILNNPKAVADYKAGKENALQFLIGKIMAQTRGKANPQTAQTILNSTLTKTK
ncbi:MAG: glutaminyl-tRNA synthase (glutamine-hydrolyzing) subunit B [Candidatus Nealsonbacteria bacterium RBG_13_42_11]|uniref:Aspartyl/glutamyl-tRNA(Asn/Gln) amidotransferase subunit B n=1 Tax=Candidatus Nealsonbacteria bacterium RBG_13_42_11 TaxID=1801663 RepID=A0A1G2DZ47_9BACT|nr:MAG: glutaminyl-tRNA synthase (glutamine-hydrolyzing) subunit B [Candidatus Nealsonbacteria bacterium RBG_13_42_11]